MAYILSKERVKFIEDNWLYEFGYNEPRPQPRDLFETMTNTWEIHYFVSRFNWDSNPTVLHWITDTQLCDMATALMIFWRASPEFYTEYASQEEADANYNGTLYRIVRNILSKWESGFYISQQIAYDPYVDVGEKEVNYENPKAKWPIPNYIKEALLGEELIAVMT